MRPCTLIQLIPMEAKAVPTSKVTVQSKLYGKKEEPKLVIPDVRMTPHIRIREGLWGHIAEGKFTMSDYCVYSTLLRHAKWGTGICITSAGSIAGNWGGQLKKNTVQVSLRRLREEGYIKYPKGVGSTGVYPVLIDKYEPQIGACKGWSLNAEASEDYENPVYEYISSTPFSEAYGASAAHNTVRVWRVSGDPHGASVGSYTERQPLQAIYQLTGQAGITGQSSQSFMRRSERDPKDQDKDDLDDRACAKCDQYPCACDDDGNRPA